MVYRTIFLAFVFLGSIVSATNVLEFGDLMILGMALPNIFGIVLLSGRIKRELDGYLGKLAAGELERGVLQGDLVVDQGDVRSGRAPDHPARRLDRMLRARAGPGDHHQHRLPGVEAFVPAHAGDVPSDRPSVPHC